MMVTIFVVMFILVLISAARRGDGYAGGFGTRYVFVNNLWYPSGAGRHAPKPGSVGTKRRPATAPVSPQRRLRRRQPRRRLWRRRLRRRQRTLRLRQQLRLRVRVCLRRRRPRGLLAPRTSTVPSTSTIL